MKTALNLPNQITIARLVLAVIFFILLSQYSQQEPVPVMLDVAAVIFIVAAVTDILDGYLARKRGEVTALGRVLDPLVDKVLVCGAFILFAGRPFVDAAGHNVTQVSAWMVVVIVGRELLVTGLRGFSESIGISFGASVYGKLKMWMQSIAAPAILFIVAHEEAWGAAADPVKKVLVWLTVIVTTLSTVAYLIRSRHILEESAPA
ncbi:MAG: CDP-diacylglycerol--glycerol-3-phosphate 3-phosphatidyltransferase [Phycisphaerae bacterium]